MSVLDNLNLDSDVLNNLKNMMGEKQVNDALSQISPEMIENFSKMMSSNNNNSGDDNVNEESSNDGIDMATLMKLKSAFNNINNANDPRSNLLNSLKPYLRESRKENIDKYEKLLRMASFFNMGDNFGK